MEMMYVKFISYQNRYILIPKIISGSIKQNRIGKEVKNK